MIKFDARITGEPVPSKNWFINKERQTKDSEGMKIDQEDYRIKILIPSCTRAHNGKFTVKASNSAGNDEVTLDVVVLGK